MIKRIEYFAMFVVPINDREKSVRLVLKRAAQPVMNGQLRKARTWAFRSWEAKCSDYEIDISDLET